jgi:hypothetical protein
METFLTHQNDENKIGEEPSSRNAPNFLEQQITTMDFRTDIQEYTDPCRDLKEELKARRERMETE